MRSEYIARDRLERVFEDVTQQNRLILQVALLTGLRIGDVLHLKRENMHPSKKHCRIDYTAQKTGKNGKAFISSSLYEKIMQQAGRVWLFEGTQEGKPKTRQAVWKNLKMACKKSNISENVTPHSCRKIYAVDLYKAQGLPAVQNALQHSSDAVSRIYAFADFQTEHEKEIAMLADLVTARIETRVAQMVRDMIKNAAKSGNK